MDPDKSLTWHWSLSCQSGSTNCSNCSSRGFDCWKLTITHSSFSEFGGTRQWRFVPLVVTVAPYAAFLSIILCDQRQPKEPCSASLGEPRSLSHMDSQQFLTVFPQYYVEKYVRLFGFPYLNISIGSFLS